MKDQSTQVNFDLPENEPQRASHNKQENLTFGINEEFLTKTKLDNLSKKYSILEVEYDTIKRHLEDLLTEQSRSQINGSKFNPQESLLTQINKSRSKSPKNKKSSKKKERILRKKRSVSVTSPIKILDHINYNGNNEVYSIAYNNSDKKHSSGNEIEKRYLKFLKFHEKMRKMIRELCGSNSRYYSEGMNEFGALKMTWKFLRDLVADYVETKRKLNQKTQLINHFSHK